MTRRLLTLSLAGITTAMIVSTPAQAGDRGRDFLKKLLFPPIPVPVPGSSKLVDLNKPFRDGKIPLPPTPKVVVPKVKVTINSDRSRHSRRYRSYYYRKHEHDHREKPQVHVCSTLLISRDQPPCHQKISFATQRPSWRHVWVMGHWQRHCCGWKWKNGYWTLPPYRGAVYTQGTWIQSRHGWRWIEGGWSTPTCY